MCVALFTNQPAMHGVSWEDESWKNIKGFWSYLKLVLRYYKYRAMPGSLYTEVSQTRAPSTSKTNLESMLGYRIKFDCPKLKTDNLFIYL